MAGTIADDDRRSPDTAGPIRTFRPPEHLPRIGAAP